MIVLANMLTRHLLGLVMLTSVLLVGCTQTPEIPMRVGTNLWIGYEPLYLARSLGYLNQEKVKLIEFVSATQTMRAIVDGAIDVATLTLDEALLLQQQGVDVSVVLVMVYSNGADAILARPGIKTLVDLRGRRIGVETTALGAYLMQRVFDKSGLALADVEIVSLELSQHEPAYITGEIDAVITFDPVRSRLLEHGAHVLLDTSDLPGEVVDVLVVRNDRVQQYKETLKVVLDSWFLAVDYLSNYPLETAEYMDARMKLGENTILKAMAGFKLPVAVENSRLLHGSPSPLQTQAEYLTSVLKRNDLLSKQTSSVSLFDQALLQELYP